MTLGHRRKRVIQTGIILCAIVSIFVYHFPFFQQDFFVYNAPLTTLLKVPDYVFRYDEWSKDYLSNEKQILLLPMLKLELVLHRASMCQTVSLQIMKHSLQLREGIIF